MTDLNVVLASASPRRRELLEHIIQGFSLASADIDESIIGSETPASYVERLAREKALKVLQESAPGSVVLGSDTCVAVDDIILGKPESEADHARMMSLLSGRWHKVYTGVALVSEEHCDVVVVETKVKFASLTADSINKYWLSAEPQDKAGGYAIQGIGGKFIEQIQGSYSSVVGLPLFETDALLTSYMQKRTS